MLWQLKDSDSFLYGSIHSCDTRPPRLPRPLEQALSKVQRIVMEADIRRLPPRSNMCLGGGHKLSQVISSDLLRKTRRHWLQSMSLAGLFWIDLLHRGAPAVLALWLYSGTAIRMGYSPSLGTERQLIKLRVGAGKPLAFLETSAAQLDVLRFAPMSEQAAYLQYTIDQIEAGHPDMRAVITAWKRDDMTQLLQATESYLVRFPCLYKALLEDRNRAWIATLADYLRSGIPTLFVAGAMHMLGPTGVIALLEERGFELQAQATPLI